MITAIAAIILSSLLLTSTLYTVYESTHIQNMQREADALVYALDTLDDDLQYLQHYSSDIRITWIAPDGTVLYDNTTDASLLDSHADRPEVMDALAQGRGESRRFSDTLAETTQYEARLTQDGCILRLSCTRSTVLGVLWNNLPLLAFILLFAGLLAFCIASIAARRIVAPINQLNLDAPLENTVYDELSLLLNRMDHQHAQIREQVHALERARSETDAIIDGMREGMILMDRKNLILSMNHSAAALFNVTGEDHLQQSLSTVCQDEGVHEMIAQAQDGHNSDLYIRRDEKTYHLFASPVRRKEKVRGVVLLILDVTARYIAEASRREFSANVSHELKTPLTSISGYAEIIRDGIAQPQDVAAFAGKIHTESKRLIALVNDILALSKLDEKQGLGAREWVELMPMLQSLIDTYAPIAQEKGLTLTLQGCSASVEGYPMLLRELFQNLIDNAIKYTPHGGHVQLSVTMDGYHVLCCVQDTGIGIPKEHQPHVFERFYRVDKSHSRATGGTGLGLAIVKHAAEVHHAQIHLESEEHQGTSITIHF